MAKDPAFLFYSQRWLEGTAELSPAEKGVYIDLLAHQHQKGSLPIETHRLCRLAFLSESEFLPIWEGLKHKFVKVIIPQPLNQTLNQTLERSLERLVNRTLSEISSERLSKGLTNRLSGKLGALIRLNKHLPTEILENIKNSFKVSDFNQLDERIASDRLSEWFNNRLAVLINLNINIKKEDKGGVGEKEEGENFGHDPDPPNFNPLDLVCYDAEKFLLESEKIFEEILCAAGQEKDDTKNKLELHKYHLWMAKNGNYPVGKKMVIAGFESWLLSDFNSNKKTNGAKINGSNGGRSGKQQAADALEALLERGQQKFDEARSKGGGA